MTCVGDAFLKSLLCDIKLLFISLIAAPRSTAGQTPIAKLLGVARTTQEKKTQLHFLLGFFPRSYSILLPGMRSEKWIAPPSQPALNALLL